MKAFYFTVRIIKKKTLYRACRYSQLTITHKCLGLWERPYLALEFLFDLILRPSSSSSSSFPWAPSFWWIRELGATIIMRREKKNYLRIFTADYSRAQVGNKFYEGISMTKACPAAGAIPAELEFQSRFFQDFYLNWHNGCLIEDIPLNPSVQCCPMLFEGFYGVGYMIVPPWCRETPVSGAAARPTK